MIIRQPWGPLTGCEGAYGRLTRFGNASGVAISSPMSAILVQGGHERIGQANRSDKLYELCRHKTWPLVESVIDFTSNRLNFVSLCRK